MLPPIRGSLCWADRLLGRLGERPGATASTKLAVAFEHADNVRELLLVRKTLPVWAHFTLLRPVFEASAQARWLLDPTIDPKRRVGRAVGAAIAGLGWRAGAEAELKTAGLTLKHSAAERRAQVLEQAREAGIRPVRMPETTTLLRALRLVPNRPEAYLFQYTSGVLHAQAWATLLGDTEQVVTETLIGSRQEANVDLTGAILIAAIRHLATATDAFRDYVAPRPDSE